MSNQQQAPKRKRRTDKLIGQVLAGKYKILKKIGEGGMGSVYIATQQPIDRKVAVKVLLGKLAEDEIALKRFEQEAIAISKMQHPNTVTIYDFGTTGDEDDEDERLYIVMEYLKGKTLTQVLRKDGVLAPPRAARIIRQVCASLGDAHQAGIIHRDLKPDNIFLTEVGSDKDWVKVLDFGVAKLADAEGAGTLTQTGMIFGTPKYMSPEQAEGRPIDYRADIYALGVVLYELLVGRPPFVADTPVGLLLKHISTPPPPFAKVRPDLSIDPRMEAIVMKALDKVPDRRHQMVSDLATELESFERAMTGSVKLTPGTTPNSVLPSGMPTEVVPGTINGDAVTPGDLAPPNRVPSNLSLGEPNTQFAPDAGLPETAAQSAQMQPPTQAQTAQQGHPTSARTAQGQAMTSGLTAPVALGGSGADTMDGGFSGEISGPIRPRPKPKAKLMVIGVGLLAGAGALFAFVSQQSQEAPVAGHKIPALTKNVVPPPPPVIDEPPPPPPPVVAPPTSDKAKRPVRRPPPRRNDPPPPPPAPARKISVELKSEPSKAMVLLKGKQVCAATPCKTELPKDDDVLFFVFKKKGFKETKKMITASRDLTVRAELEKKAVASRPPPPPPAKVTKRKPPPPPPPPVKGDPLNDRVGDLK